MCHSPGTHQRGPFLGLALTLLVEGAAVTGRQKTQFLTSSFSLTLWPQSGLSNCWPEDSSRQSLGSPKFTMEESMTLFLPRLTFYWLGENQRDEIILPKLAHWIAPSVQEDLITNPVEFIYIIQSYHKGLIKLPTAWEEFHFRPDCEKPVVTPLIGLMELPSCKWKMVEHWQSHA